MIRKILYGILGGFSLLVIGLFLGAIIGAVIGGRYFEGFEIGGLYDYELGSNIGSVVGGAIGVTLGTWFGVKLAYKKDKSA